MDNYYLCCNLINPNTNKEEICYLLYDSLDSILKFTSYCNDEKMFINTLNFEDKKIGDLINRLAVVNNKFFITKGKNSNEKFKVLYKENDDLLYTKYKDIYTLLKKRGFIVYNNDEDIYEQSKEIYKLMEEFIKDKKLKSEIIYNFSKKYDSDKNLDYINYDKFPLSKKIAFVEDNILLTLKYIFKDPYKKLVFLSKLKRILKTRLISDDIYQKNKDELNSKLKKEKKDYIYLINRIYESLNNFLRINKKEANKESYNIDISVDDMIYRYKKMLEDDTLTEDEKDDIRTYIDLELELSKKKYE